MVLVALLAKSADPLSGEGLTTVPEGLCEIRTQAARLGFRRWVAVGFRIQRSMLNV